MSVLKPWLSAFEPSIHSMVRKIYLDDTYYARNTYRTLCNASSRLWRCHSELQKRGVAIERDALFVAVERKENGSFPRYAWLNVAVVGDMLAGWNEA